MTENLSSGWVYEVFASIQGEGLYCGQRQTFIRLAGCNLACAYCDTISSREEQPSACRIETSAGIGSFDNISNPINSDDILSACKHLGSKVISITGGEPLMQQKFLTDLMRKLKQNGFSTHLETNGTLHIELQSVIPYTDVIAMDIKLPSTSGIDCWDAHTRFLKVASQTSVFVKAVAGQETTYEDITRCADLIAAVNSDIPFIIQPMTSEIKVDGIHLVKLQEAALDKLNDVRVIPQCHKQLGLL